MPNGFLTRLFGGPQAGLLSPEQQKQAGAKALTDFGLSLMVTAAPPPFGQPPTPLGKAIAMGTMAGRESFSRFVESTRQTETREAVSAAIQSGTEGEFDVEALGSAFNAAIQGGDIDTARTIVPLLQAAMSNRAATLPNLVSKELPLSEEEGGGRALVWFNPKTGTQVGPILKLPDEGLSSEEMGKIQQAYAQFNTRTAKLQEIPAQFRRVFATTSELLASYDEDRGIFTGGDEDVAFRTVSALSAFARLIDPGSVVRSEEMKLLMGQGSLKQKIESLIESARSGRVTASLIRALAAEARTQLESQAPEFNNAKATAEDRLIRLGFEETDFVFPNPFQTVIDEFFSGAPARPGTPGAAENAQSLRDKARRTP